MQDDMNVSMAGLTDMSMGEVKRLDDSEANNFSMAELSVDDVDESGASGRMRSGKISSTALPKGNILDALKEEDMQLLKMKEQEDLIEQKKRKLNDSVAAFQEVDESDYDSEDDAQPSGGIKRRTFGKSGAGFNR